MKLVEMKCKNCGANLKIEDDLKEVTCPFCNSNFRVDDEVQHHKFDDAEQAGYEFEKGKIRAQEEAEQRRRDEQNRILQEQYEKDKKRENLKWWILGWIFFFPVPLTVLIWKSKWDKKKKIIAIVLLWGIVLGIEYMNYV